MEQRRVEAILDRHDDLKTAAEYTYSVLLREKPSLLTALDASHPIDLFQSGGLSAFFELIEYAEKLDCLG